MDKKIEILSALDPAIFRKFHDSEEAKEQAGPAPFKVGEIVQIDKPGHGYHGSTGEVLMCGRTIAKIQVMGFPIRIQTEYLRVTRREQ